MTLNEAIKHAREVAESRTDLCEECRAEHEQLAEWLEELVRLREENERLKSVEFTCGFIKPHKVLECPIFDEIVKAKADTVREIFAEIEKARMQHTFGDIDGSELNVRLYHLKKKYTEGEG